MDVKMVAATLGNRLDKCARKSFRFKVIHAQAALNRDWNLDRIPHGSYQIPDMLRALHQGTAKFAPCGDTVGWTANVQVHYVVAVALDELTKRGDGLPGAFHTLERDVD